MFLVEFDGRRRKVPFSYLFNFLLQLAFFFFTYTNNRINVGLNDLVTAPALSLKTSLGFTFYKCGLESDFS